MATTKEQIIEDFKALSAEDQKEVQNAIYKRPDAGFNTVYERYQQRVAERIEQGVSDADIDDVVNNMIR